MGWLWELRTWPVGLGWWHQHPLPLSCPNALGREAPGWLCVHQDSHGITEGLGGIVGRDNSHEAGLFLALNTARDGSCRRGQRGMP